MPSTREEEVATTLALLFDLTTHTSELVAPALDAYGLTFNTAYALWVIKPDDPPPAMRTVAERMHCAPSNLTFVADQLESRGLIRRSPSPDDRRQRVVELTADGYAARQAVVAAFLAACPLSALGDDRLRTLRDLMELARAGR